MSFILMLDSFLESCFSSGCKARRTLVGLDLNTRHSNVVRQRQPAPSVRILASCLAAFNNYLLERLIAGGGIECSKLPIAHRARV